MVEFRALAAAAKDARTRDAFLQVAEEYERLAGYAQECIHSTDAILAGLTTIRDSDH
jgi:hypothetical protein